MKWDEITSKREFAEYIGVPYKYLTYMIYQKGIDKSYESFEIPKKSGGVRIINSPHKELKTVQKKILKKLEERLFKLESEGKISLKLSHGFVKQKSIITNSEIHRNKRIVLNIDIENFFPSFHFGRVSGFFEKNKYFKLPKEVAIFIAQLSCYKGSLPQGAPCSPIITNLICQILDYRISLLARNYNLSYSRYADDLTFSTNNMKFIDRYDDFLREIKSLLKHSGFTINKEKTRLQTQRERQTVTGLVVNRKVNIPAKFYKNTRAMAYNLYTKGEYFIDGERGSLNQLLGRFNFIDQLEKYNNNLQNKLLLKRDYIEQQKFLLKYYKDYKNGLDYLNRLSSKEREYRKYLYYYHFFASEYPVVVTEGKTDSRYLKAALKKNYLKYPNLVTKDEKNQFKFRIKFLRRSSILEYYFVLLKDGAAPMKNLSNFWLDTNNEKQFPNYNKYFIAVTGHSASTPVIFLFDNELKNKRKPITNFINHISDENNKSLIINEVSMKNYYNISSNLYLLTHPSESEDEEIEDLFSKETRNHRINGKIFSKNENFDITKEYGKNEFSKYIMNNYQTIDFSEFTPLLDNLNRIIEEYQIRHEE